MGLFGRKKEQKAKEQGILTLYSVTQDSSCIFKTAREEFADEIKSADIKGESLIMVLKDDTKAEFNLKADKNFVSQQTNGMANFFSQAPMENKQVLEQAIFQIHMFTCIIGIKFDLSTDSKRNDDVVGTIYKIAEKTQSLILYPNMELYTPKDQLVISIAGKTDFESYYPIASADLLKGAAKPTIKDEERYRKIIKECDEKGIPHTNFMLNTQVMEQESDVPGAEEIAKRAAAVFSCALYAECLLMEGGSLELAKKEFSEIDKRYGVMQYLSKKEEEYIQRAEPEQSDLIQFSWQYERCAVLLWALGLMELNPPTDICDVRSVAKIIRTYDSIDDLVQAANMKSKEELLDMHTRILYFNWSCVESRIKNREMPAGLDAGVVQEQHYALNWLVGANGKCDWDDISTNT